MVVVIEMRGKEVVDSSVTKCSRNISLSFKNNTSIMINATVNSISVSGIKEEMVG